MKNKILVQICDKEYTLITEEPEDYVRKIASEITRMIDATAYKNLRTSKLDAAMITCLDLCDKIRKISEDNDNMRREIVGYIDEIGKLSKRLSVFERQKSGKKQAVQRFADEPEEAEADDINDTEE
jgi:cell division protein ZapA